MSTGAHDLRELEQDPRLFLYTSLTAGSSHIITATSRMETILKANRIPFQAVDTATDEKARRLWARRAGKRKIPGLVKEGYVIGDLEQVEEWNEFGELKENIGPVPAHNVSAPAPSQLAKPSATGGGAAVSEKGDTTPAQQRIALPGAAEIAARNKPAATSSSTPAASTTSGSEATKPEPSTSVPSEKPRAVKIAGEPSREEHLSAPPSALQSGTATPAEPAADAKLATLSSIPKSVKAEHQGSELHEAPQHVVKEVEKDTSTSEEPEIKSVTKGVEELQVGSGATTQDQKAKDASVAGESVED
ncbi:hypothetical protein K431DRAFT_235531 [Polychaeton citri CBS 116435]|uniref:Glutaredoxin domain-containing protein n=1 Tax=Polychaeton citri CBS 116435 TaxID=1314669 RepID=A0A9P4PYZ1_9PEZI|nr:hypothetical protein K431DRAFT_235531 [Polychaeton citri CBS 116435]